MVFNLTVSEREKEAKHDTLQQQLQHQQQQQQQGESGQQQTSEQSEENKGGEHMCPFCNYTSNSEMRIQAHVLAQHPQSEGSAPSPAKEFLCPLCQDGFRDKASLERHVMQIHSVNSEGLQRLLMLVDQSHWLNNVSRPKENETRHNQSETGSEEKEDGQSSVEEQNDDENKCQTCQKTFRNIDELCSHQNESGHLELKQTPGGPGYLCWKKGCNQYFQSAHSLQMHFREIHARGGTGQNMAVSEKHVYKYRCSQCSLAFKTLEKLQLHSQYHLIRDATKCVLCGRSFRSVLALHKHVETAHTELSEDDMAAYKQSLMNNPLLLAGISGQILDPSTNELLRKESMKMEGEEAMETDEGKEQEDGMNQGAEGENSDDSIVYKEQQFLEDYLNSQAIAEDSYNDPSRKYKCHRCKVAFTRQTYLTSHNKTLLHRKGEKLSYPMEKYLDPNRPYKCDVCKESFTQKNILLVHYNSVSHLHKLKRAMQEQQQQQQNNNNNNALFPHASASVAAAALAASLGVSPAALGQKCNTSQDEDDKKPYKCNICKVAYSQGSTLDIHMRSVLHQTRASKIQDLAISGQIDLSKPLIEQPEPQKAQDQHKKLIQDILGGSPKQLVSSPPSSGGSQLTPPGPANSIVPPAASTPNSTVPTSLSNSTSNSASVIGSPTSHGMLSCQRCSALFVNQEQLNTHQQLYCLFGSQMSLFPPMPTPPSSGMANSSASMSSPQPSNKTPPPIALTPSNEDSFPRLSLPTKKSSQMYKHLLESFGFDLVMQFNENHQRRQRKEREETEKFLSEITSTTPMEEPVAEAAPEPEKLDVKMEEEAVDLPEVAKSTCQHCNKEFSSVWVLKAHCEEVHRDLVPLDFLEKYAQQIKCEYEKKTVTPSGNSTNTSNTSTVTSTTASTPNETSTPEKDEDNKEAIQAKIGMSQQQTPPEATTAPSTPTASSTPASSTDSIPANLSGSLAAAVAAAGMGGPNSGNIPMALAQHMNEMQAALNVMAASQIQQQLQQFNPMMMGMAGLGMGLPLGLNMPALAAMNLQPPLVPMMMPPPGFDSMVGLGQGQGNLFNPQSGGMDTATLLAKQQQALMQQQQQVVSYFLNKYFSPYFDFFGGTNI
jgi:AT-binding transcription factor 1